MAKFLFTNFGQSTLSAPLVQGDTVVHISPSDATSFPTPGADEVFAIVLADGKNEPEILHCTNNPGTGLLTVLRGQEGTPAQTWGTGTSVLHTHTAASLQWFITGGQLDLYDQLLALINQLKARIDQQEQEIDEIENQVENTIPALIESELEDAYAAIQETRTVVTDFNFAQATINLEMLSRVGSNEATLTEFMQTTASSQSAQAEYNLQLTARMNNAEAAAEEALFVSVDANESLATLTNTVSANFNNNQASITSEAAARSSQYGSLSSLITTVNSTLGSHSVTITETALAVDGISGRWGIQINNNGVISGLELLSGLDDLPTMNFQVDRLKVSNATGVVSVTLFEIVGTTTYMNNVVANNIGANAIGANQIVSNSVEARHLKSDIIETRHLKTNTIEGYHIKANEIETAHLQTESVTTGIIRANNVTRTQSFANPALQGPITTGGITVFNQTVSDVNGPYVDALAFVRTSFGSGDSNGHTAILKVDGAEVGRARNYSLEPHGCTMVIPVRLNISGPHTFTIVVTQSSAGSDVWYVDYVYFQLEGKRTEVST